MENLDWQNVPEHDFYLYARSFHTAAKRLAGTLDQAVVSPFDSSPVLSAYRKTFELILKVIVLTEGGNFLATKPDPISVGKSRSVAWLAQFMCQIITELGWEDEFRCEGVENLADFKTIIEELNRVDPDFNAFRCPTNGAEHVRGFLRRLDAVFDLLDSTTDELAAEWDLRSEAGDYGVEFKPTVH